MSEPLFLGRIEKVQLTDEDFVLISDAVGGRVKTPINGARGLHRELGKFLATRNDALPIPAPTRKDFKELRERVEKLEKREPGGDAV